MKKPSGKDARKPMHEVPRLAYRPAQPYPWDLEIFSASGLRRRLGTTALHSTYRYELHMLLFTTRGRCIHVVDFEPVRCAPGSLLVLKPGQVHRIEDGQDWEGWMVLFRPEALQASQVDQLALHLEDLPIHLRLGNGERQAVVQAIARMRDDARRYAALANTSFLLRHQLHALLWRLAAIADRQGLQAGPGNRSSRRFRDFKRLLERRHAGWHKVAQYADALGCSEKSLTRAAMEACGISAKALIASRVNLEAKRLLTHTALSVTSIGERLGFDEATNFAKFFKRETGCTPAEFRRSQREHASAPG